MSRRRRISCHTTSLNKIQQAMSFDKLVVSLREEAAFYNRSQRYCKYCNNRQTSHLRYEGGPYAMKKNALVNDCVVATKSVCNSAGSHVCRNKRECSRRKRKSKND